MPARVTFVDFSSSKLTWLLENVPEVQAANDRGTLRLGNVDAWLTDKLGGLHATDASTASRTQLHRLGDPGWDDWLCDRFGVPSQALPEVRDSVGGLGVLRHARWSQDLPLTARVVDQQAALAGAGAVSAGRVKATYGTGSSLMTLTPAPMISERGISASTIPLRCPSVSPSRRPPRGSEYPPPGPGVERSGTPILERACRSRSIVRRVTPNSSASPAP